MGWDSGKRQAPLLNNQESVQSSKDLSFSVIIPTFARPEELCRCLESLSTLQPGVPFEVIVVDDGTPEPIEPHIASLQAKMDLKVIRIDNGGPARARNLGAASAQGENLVFLDDDCTVAPDWLESLHRALQSTPRAAVGGKTINVLADNPYAVASQLLVDYLYDYFSTTSPGSFFTTNNLSLSRVGFLELNGFDETFPRAAGEDREFCHRWIRSGRSLRHDAQVTVYHAHNLDLRRYLRQHFNYGSAARHYWAIRSGGASGAARREPLAFYVGLLAYPFGKQRLRLATLKTSVLFVLAQIANAIGYLSSMP